MRALIGIISIILLCCSAALADTHHVDINNATPSAPYTNWVTAATNIQDAVDAASSNDTVLVADGHYNITSTITVSSDITVISVNGAEETVVDANYNCRVFLMTADNCQLIGFSVRDGYSFNGGAGAFCSGVSATVHNCILGHNTSQSDGGGMYGGTAYNCLFADNIAGSDDGFGDGGGMYGGTAYNCTFVGNQAKTNVGRGGYGGAMYQGTAYNCAFKSNYCYFEGGGIYQGSAYYCLFFDNHNVDWWEENNYYETSVSHCLIADPQFVETSYHLTSNSPCINAGANAYVTVATDLDGMHRILGGTVDIGAYEYPLATLDITNTSVNVANTVDSCTIGGTCFACSGYLTWTNAANAASGQAPITDNNFELAGIPLACGGNTITVLATNELGTADQDSIYIYRYTPEDSGNSPVHYVSTSGASIWPYTDWSTAASSIQLAIDASADGDTVLVNDGIYDQSGGPIMYNMFNRIAITKAISVESVNGPDSTFIVGEGPLGPDAMRCAYISNGDLIGFTLTNGHTRIFGDWGEIYGGGVICESNSVLIADCVIVGNMAGRGGGGILQGYNALTLNNCIISGNEVDWNWGYYGGGIEGYGPLSVNGCTLKDNRAPESGGAIYHRGGGITLCDCILSGNSSDYGVGGGIFIYKDEFDNNIYNCIFYQNSASYGGGMYGDATVCNSTFVENQADVGGGMSGDSYWQYYAKAYNCIFWNNTSTWVSNDIDDLTECKFSCSTQLIHGVDGNITNAPQFVDFAGGNYHLAPTSPCINTGSNAYVTVATDLDGNPRIIDGTVDMGAYEYGFECITDCSTCPSGMRLKWIPVGGMNSTVMYSTNLVTMPFTDLSAPMDYPLNCFTDTVHGAEAQCFYKVEMVP